MTNTERRRIVQEWKTSEMSMAAFCRTKKVQYATFRLWLKRFDDDGKLPNGSANPGLVKLEIPPASHSAVSGELAMGIHCGPYTVTIPRGFEASDLTRVLQTLKNLGA